jgi:hypothetical protein
VLGDALYEEQIKNIADTAVANGKNAEDYPATDFEQATDSLVKLGFGNATSFKITDAGTQDNPGSTVSIYIARQDVTVTVKNVYIKSGSASGTIKVAEIGDQDKTYTVSAGADSSVLASKISAKGEISKYTFLNKVIGTIADDDDGLNTAYGAIHKLADNNENVTLYAKYALDGDVNLNGSRNIADVATLRGIAQQTVSATDEQKLAGDLNRNGSVNIADVAVLRKAIQSGSDATDTLNKAKGYVEES